jgi:predicted AAA+ superfamily ATPase
MLVISEDQVIERIRADNPWWDPPHEIGRRISQMRPRPYFDLVLRLIQQRSPKRALILMGPRRVGKTVMLHQAIRRLIQDGAMPTSLCYINVELPLYNGLGIEQFVELAWRASGADKNGPFFFFFDEIQYLREWEIHLKTAVDAYDEIKFIASGSAAAALRLKSNETGAGRFTDITLPPLTFFEYLDLLGRRDLVSIEGSRKKGAGKTPSRRTDQFSAPDIEALNREFLGYLNFGGYPEVIFSPEIQADPGRYIRSDIIDKVLLRDLPSLYGIQDIQELNSLFTSLAYNTGNEVSLEGLSQHSGVAKNTIKRYIEYLEAAFLIKIVHRVDRAAKSFKRANFFKVYLTNPSMRSALFAPLKSDDEAMGNLVETAIFAQWFHSPDTRLHYARWNDGEVDIISLRDNMKPSWAVEVKWSDAYEEDPRKLKSLLQFCGDHKNCSVAVTSRTKSSIKEVNGITIAFRPASLYCFLLGYNLIRGQIDQTGLGKGESLVAPDRDRHSTLKKPRSRSARNK